MGRVARWRKFTREELEQFVKESKSYAELARKIGYKNPEQGAAYAGVHKMIEELGLDTSHFTGQGWLSGRTYESNKYIPFEVYSQMETAQTNKIRNKLLRDGIKERRCECCGNIEWNGVPIPLEVHHKDGNKKNNSIDNLQLLCPNCHALTETYKGRNTEKHKNNQAFIM